MHHLLIFICLLLMRAHNQKKNGARARREVTEALCLSYPSYRARLLYADVNQLRRYNFFLKRCLRQKEWSAGASRGDGGLVPIYSFLVGAPLLTTSSTSLNTPMPVATLNGKPGLAATGSCQIHTFYCSGLTPTMLTKPWALTTSLLVRPCVPQLDVSSNV